MSKEIKKEDLISITQVMEGMTYREKIDFKIYFLKHILSIGLITQDKYNILMAELVEKEFFNREQTTRFDLMEIE